MNFFSSAILALVCWMIPYVMSRGFGNSHLVAMTESNTALLVVLVVISLTRKEDRGS